MLVVSFLGRFMKNKITRRSFLPLYLIGFLLIFIFFYAFIQYYFFFLRAEHDFLHNTLKLENCFKSTLKRYNFVLKEYGKEIKTQSLFLDSNKLADFDQKRTRLNTHQ